MVKTILSRSESEILKEDYHEYKVKIDEINDSLLQVLYQDPTLTVDRFYSSSYMRDNIDKRRKYIYFYSQVNTNENGENKNN
jgi:hypothetical protein